MSKRKVISERNIPTKALLKRDVILMCAIIMQTDSLFWKGALFALLICYVIFSWICIIEEKQTDVFDKNND